MSSINSPSTELDAAREVSPHTGSAYPARRWDSAALVALILALLGALVWGLQPRQLTRQPAPLRPAPVACQKPPREFVPTNITEIPRWAPHSQRPTATAAAFQALSQDQKERALLRLNMEGCTCGCKLSVAVCLVSELKCDASGSQAGRILEATGQR
jgi:hypothetical protein